MRTYLVVSTRYFVFKIGDGNCQLNFMRLNRKSWVFYFLFVRRIIRQKTLHIMLDGLTYETLFMCKFFSVLSHSRIHVGFVKRILERSKWWGQG